MLVFAVTDAHGPAVRAEFFGMPVELTMTGDVAAVTVDGDVPPAISDDTLAAHARVIDTVATRRACLPHRFGVIVDRDRLLDDLDHNHGVLTEALTRVRDADEWLARLRLRPQEAADHVLRTTSERPPSANAIDAGRWVHQLIGDWLGDAASSLGAALTEHVRSADVELHTDALGADIVLVADRSRDADDIAALVTATASGWGAIGEFELFGPTPCFRSAAHLVGALHTEAVA